MEHRDVIERGLLEAYSSGRIPPEEEADFEAHFFACHECAEQLELQRGLERGLKAMVAEDLARQMALRAGLFAWLARRGAVASWALPLALLLLAAGLPSFWLLRQRGALREAQEESAALRARSGELAQRLSAQEKSSAATRRGLEAKLAALSAPGAPAAAPLVNTPVFLLSLIRGTPGEAGPAIDPARAGSHFSLALDVDATPGVESYRVTVTDPKGAQRFRQAGLRRNSLETLLLTFPSSYFAPGDYRLKVEALSGQGTATEVGTYRYRIVRP